MTQAPVVPTPIAPTQMAIPSVSARQGISQPLTPSQVVTESVSGIQTVALAISAGTISVW